MNAAPPGTVLRVLPKVAPAKPAHQLSGFTGPFSLTAGGKLLLTVNGTDTEITFKGEPAAVTGDTALADPVPLTADNNTLNVSIDGISQAITLPDTNTTPAALVTAINDKLQGAEAGLDAGKLKLSTKRQGASTSISVQKSDALGFTTDAADMNKVDANNNISDIMRVTTQEINNLLIAAGILARIALLPNGQVVLATLDAGNTASLTVRTGAGSVADRLGFKTGAAATGVAGGAISYYIKVGNNWVASDSSTLSLAGLGPNEAPQGGAEFITVSVTAQDADGVTTTYDELALDGNHPRYLGTVLAQNPSRRFDALQNRYAFVNDGLSAFALLNALFSAGDESILDVTGGNDGVEPRASNYETALARLAGLEDIAIVAAPGYSAYSDYQGIQNALIAHAEARRAYRIAVLDTPPYQTPGEVREIRGKMDSTYAALYYPWVVISNPLARAGADDIPFEIPLPPSGFVSGIYARNDVQRGVYKAPANEVVRSALRFEVDINFAQQEMLNPLGVNCLRYLSGRGYRVWGARTVSSDPEWKYVNIRRYFNYVENSIDRGTQWAVFEPNGERLWTNIRTTLEAFLYNEWVSGALLGSSPKEAFFVRCDRSTMTQNDLDNGRLICLIGIAAIKPAEFVIFRIGQKTADARS
jgi:hypothetical protein